MEEPIIPATDSISNVLTPKELICAMDIDNGKNINSRSVGQPSPSIKSELLVDLDTETKTEEDQDAMINNLMAELSQAQQEVTKNEAKLQEARDTISKQKEQLLAAAKFVMQHQKFVARIQQEKREGGEMKMKVLEQTLIELEDEKQQRNAAEVKVVKLKTSLKTIQEGLSSVILSLQVSNDMPLMNDHLLFYESESQMMTLFTGSIFNGFQHQLKNMFSSVVHGKLTKLSENFRKRRCEVTETSSRVMKMMEEVQKRCLPLPSVSGIKWSPPQRGAISSTQTKRPSSPVHHGSSLVRKRKRSSTSSSQSPPKKLLAPRRSQRRKSPVKRFGHVEKVAKVVDFDEHTSLNGAPSSLENYQTKKSAKAAHKHHGVDPKDKTGLLCVCGQKFSDTLGRNIHLKRCTETPKFHCEKCSKRFLFHRDLNQHYKYVHKVIPKLSYGCRICGQVFKTRSAMMIHSRSAHTALFANRSKPGKNAALHSKNEDRNRPTPKQLWHGRDNTAPRDQYHCICGKEFHRYGTLFGHIRFKNNPHIFKCHRCSKAFNVHALLKKHLLRCHKLKYKNQKYGCASCAQTFPSMSQLSTHRKFSHYTTVQRFRTKTSSGMQLRSTVTSFTLSSVQHNRALVPVSKKKTSTAEEEKPVYHKIDMSRPTRLHCVCGYRAINKSYLRRHLALSEHINAGHGEGPSKIRTRKQVLNPILKSINDSGSSPFIPNKSEHEVSPSDPTGLSCICGKKWKNNIEIKRHIKYYKMKG